MVRRVKGWAGQAYNTAHEMAPGIAKGAAAAKRAYQSAADSGLVDDLAGRHAGRIHRGARNAMQAYDKFEDAARRTDGVVRAARGD